MSPPTVAGREVHPVALALTLAASAVVVGFALGPGAGSASVWRIVSVGYAAGLAVILTAGWLLDRREWTRAAMLASVGLWTYTGAVAVWVIASPTSALLALAWALLAAGSYTLEVRGAGAASDPGRRRG